jgi:hypothetical protein
MPLRNEASATDTSNINLTESAVENIVMDSGSVASLLGAVSIFDGSNTSDVSEFFESIDEIGAIAKWTDVEKCAIAKIKTTGEARNFLRANPEFCRLPWLELKNRFKEEFSKVISSAQAAQQFACCYQRQDEKVRQYENRLKLAGMAMIRLTDDNERNKERMIVLQEQLHTQFCVGVNKKIQRYVLSSSAKTFKEAVEVAIKEEANENLVSNKEINAVYQNGGHVNLSRRYESPPRPTWTNPSTSRGSDHTRGGRQNFSYNSNRNQPQQQRNKFTQFKCYVCGEPGHISKYCQKPVEIICFRCRNKGHMARDCKEEIKNNCINIVEAREDNLNEFALPFTPLNGRQ